jgi:hypothetical protein
MIPDSSMRKMIGDIRRGIRGSVRKDPYSNIIEFSDSSMSGNKFHKEELEIKTDSLQMTTEINHLKIEQEIGKVERAMAGNDRMQAEIEKQKIKNEQELVKMKIKVNSKMEKLNEVMSRLAVEFVKDNDSPIKGVPQMEMDSLVKTELKNKGVNTSYNFGILNDRKNSLVMAKDSSKITSLLSSKYKTVLFPNEIVSRGEKPAVVFSFTYHVCSC